MGARLKDLIIMYVKEVFWCYYVFSLGPLQAVDLFDKYFKSGHISSVCCRVYAMSDCIKYPNCLSIVIQQQYRIFN